ncbi:MAG: VWA domain-containing protein [Gemmatimonadetes bacterium]|nr:VWA domain-containing protein [Gemmatimonadota bacterium]
MNLSFANPWVLLLLLWIPAGLWILRKVGARTALVHSRTASVARAAGRRAARIARVPAWLRTIAIAALVLALAAPQTGSSVVNMDAEGIAIVIALDISSSMLAEDFAPQNRLAVAKEKVAAFVRGRQYDRIGLVAFAGEALTQVPITIDYPILYQSLDELRAGSQQLEDGTAIGTAIATAANRLRRAPGESRVIILMTDGENNRGEIDPVTAAQAAAAFDVKIYTIGVGSEGLAPIPVATGPYGLQYATLPVHIDEELLRQISSITDGLYFRATNEAALDSIYQQIDELEKSTVEVRRYIEYTPRVLPFVLVAGLLLLLEWGLRASRWGRVP